MRSESLSLNKRLFGKRQHKLPSDFGSRATSSSKPCSSTLLIIPLIIISSPSTISIENRLKQQEEQIDGRQDGREEADRLPPHLQVQLFDLLCYLFSIFTYLADILLDLLVAWMHYSNNRYWACIFVSSLVIFPSLVLNIVAAIWWVDDEFASQRCQTKRHQEETSDVDQKIQVIDQNSTQLPTTSLSFRLVMCVLQLGPILWYIEAIKSAMLFQKENIREASKRDSSLVLLHYCQMVEAERDASLLRFFESFMESMPQLLLQGFLVAQDLWRMSLFSVQSEKQVVLKWWSLSAFGIVYVQLLSIGFSLLSASWSIVAQHRSLRVASPNKANMSYTDSILQLYWHLFTLTSRYICLVMFTLAFKEWTLVVIVLHYLISLIHISALQAIATQTRFVCMEVGLLMINAAIHIFTPFNMAEGPTKLQYTLAYAIEFMEGMLLLGLCLWKPTFDYPYKSHIAIIALMSFVIGVTIMISYYAFFHPSRRLPSTRRQEIIDSSVENTATAFEMNDDW